ncbi:MAG: WD40/YVTN/BNR-like repeat-containing protein [Lysobacterales bacterium]
MTFALIGVLSVGWAQETAEGFDSSVAASETMPRATESLLLDVTATSVGYVAVGERGHVLQSADGEGWEQVSGIPTRSTLTAVTSWGNLVWAVGHDQVVIHSADGGKTWVRQHVSADINDPQSNSPLLAVHFSNDNDGLAVGAYAAFLRTTDGGATWQASSLELASDDSGAEDEADAGGYDDGFDDFVDFHLNGIAELAGGALYIAAEQGNAYRSTDGGLTWTALTLPYGGSMFGAMTLADDQLLTFGLRGNAFSSVDQGDTWEQISTGSLNSLNGAASAGNGRVVMVGVNGEMLIVTDQGVQSREIADGNDIAAVVATDKHLILVGEGGAWKYSMDDVLNDQ